VTGSEQALSQDVTWYHLTKLGKAGRQQSIKP